MSKKLITKTPKVKNKALSLISEKLKELELILKISNTLDSVEKKQLIKKVTLLIKEC